MPLHLRDILFLGLTVAIAGCDRQKPPAASQPPVRIFATVHTVGDLVRQVGGKYVDVDFAIEDGRSLQGLQLSAELMQQKSRAQIVIAGGSEPWAVADANNPREPTRAIRLDMLRGKAASQPIYGQNDDTQIGLEWLDPVVGERTAEELARRLRTLRPDHEVYFDARAKEVTAQLDALVNEYTPKFRTAQRRRVMSLTHEFDYLAERFNIDIVVVVGTTPDRIGDAQLAALQRTSRDEHLVTLLVRTDTPQGLIQDLAKRTGFRIVTMDPYGSSSGNGRDSYLELLRYNMDQLLDALNGAPNGAPAGGK